MATCVIQFQNNPLRMYYGGEILMGSAILTVTDGMNVRGVFVKIEGRAYVCWSETNRQEIFFTKVKDLLGNRKNEFELKADTYELTFHFILPQLLPMSLEGKHGYIRYAATIIIDRPLWTDEKFSEAFAVLKTLNLSLDTSHKSPIYLSDRKQYNLLCCLCSCMKSGELSITGQIPQSGYVPGEIIHISAKVSNKSTTYVKCHARIIKIITHKVGSEPVTEAEVLIDEILGGCQPGTEHDFKGDVRVPATLPTDEHFTDIFSVQYELRIIGKADVRCQSDLKLIMPIVIGTYPIMQQQRPLTCDNEVSASYPSDFDGHLHSVPNERNGATVPYDRPVDSELPTYDQAGGDTSKTEDGADFLPYDLVYRSTPIPHGREN